MKTVGSFVSDRRGVAAVEFGLIAPVVALVLLIVGDGATLLLRYYDMRAAVSSGAQYVMETGTNASLTTAQSIASSAWNTKTASSTVTATNACYCGASTSTCNVLCADSSVPTSYTTLAASSPYSGLIISQTLTANQVIRVR